MIEELRSFADDAPAEEEGEEAPMDAATQEFWDAVIKKAKTLKPLAPENLSLATLDQADDEAQCFNVVKGILKDWGLGDKEIMAEVELLKEIENSDVEDMSEDDFTDFRTNTRVQMRKKVSSPEWKTTVDQSLAEYFAPPYENTDGTPDWMKGYCMEFILTTILDHKSTFETSEEWDEDLFLEKVNGLLESHKLRIGYDPNYNWEDESGQALTVTLETTEGQFVDSVKYKFPDPSQFDQPELMEPINKLLAPKDLQFIDASYNNEDAEMANYNWILLSAKDATRLTAKYGPVKEWYQRLPASEDFDDEEGTPEDDLEEPEPPKKQAPNKPKKH